MKAALLAEKHDWQVWTDWYEDRLEGRIREDERELAYVRIEEALWNQSPAAVNGEIKRLIDEQISHGDLHAIEDSDSTKLEGIVSRGVAEPRPRQPVPPEPSPKPPPSGWQSSFDQPSRRRVPAAAIHEGRSWLIAHEPPPIEAIPEQASAATRFGINPQGLIDVVPDPPALEPLTDALQREFYDESRGKARVLVELGPNLMAS
jgi:hypothetical protein